MKNGEEILADEVIINADFAHSMSSLFSRGQLKKYSKENLKKKKYSCSTFMLYLAVDKIYNAPHHNIYFANDYKKNVEDIFENKILSEDNSFYIQNPIVTDKSLAPEGKSGLYVLVPVPNNSGSVDWEKEKETFAQNILAQIEKRTEFTDLKNHILEMKIHTPDTWQNDYNVFFGATFNLAHNLTQMLYFRPHNEFEEVGNCYLVGGGTHPGSGLPTIYESGRITSEMICKKYEVDF
jgi:phytoene desaturase